MLAMFAEESSLERCWVEQEDTHGEWKHIKCDTYPS
jgi:hypothetical protein